jgi:biotin carboxyl carrier protein
MSKALATYFATIQDMPDTEYKVEILEDGAIKKIAINGTVYEIDYNVGGDSIYSIIMNNRSNGVQISPVDDSVYEVKNRGDYFRIKVIDELQKMRLSRTQQTLVGRQVITAQMPGVILRVYVKPGDRVSSGTPLCVLSAMKMENEIRSPVDGEVKNIYIEESDKVSVGHKMLVIE